MRHAASFLAGLFALLVVGPTPGQAQTLRAAHAGGGHTAMSGGEYTLRASTGQPGTQILGDDPYLGAGFWRAARNEDAKLPVELATFDARSTTGSTRLTWTTASETNNAGFEVQRADASGPGTPSWHAVDFVESKAEGGTTTQATQYRFSDADFSYAADTLAYRLKQVDVDGTTHLTDPVTIGRAVQEVELLGTFPNPARTRATVRFAVPKDLPTDAVTMRLYDVLGRQVRTVVGDTDAGRHERQLDLSNLPSGVYFLRLQAGTTVKTRRLTVVR
jgi:hypothetical protein